jgi:hypothetical protein
MYGIRNEVIRAERTNDLTAYSESIGDTGVMLVAVVLWEGGVFPRPGPAQGFIYVECFHVG